MYKTTHKRIPENISALVAHISNLYKEYVCESGCLDFDIKNLLPSVPAIYVVFNKEEILYVGQTKNLTRVCWKSKRKNSRESTYLKDKFLYY